jgi:hypothetical protein
MNIVQHRKTRKYLAGRDKWVGEIEKAKDFGTLTQAIKNCKPTDRPYIEVIKEIFCADGLSESNPQILK